MPHSMQKCFAFCIMQYLQHSVMVHSLHAHNSACIKHAGIHFWSEQDVHGQTVGSGACLANVHDDLIPYRHTEQICTHGARCAELPHLARLCCFFCMNFKSAVSFLLMESHSPVDSFVSSNTYCT